MSSKATNTTDKGKQDLQDKLAEAAEHEDLIRELAQEDDKLGEWMRKLKRELESEGLL